MSRLDVIIGSRLLVLWDKQVGTKEIVSALCGPGLVARVFIEMVQRCSNFFSPIVGTGKFETRTRRLMV